MSFSDEGGEDTALEVEVLLEAEQESTEDPPEEDWSSLTCLHEHNRIQGNIKRDLFEQGLYDPGSETLCTAYVPLSDSSIWRHPYYAYPCVVDPGVEDALLSPAEPIDYPPDGQKLYLAICEEMEQCPVGLFYRGLLNDKIDLKYYSVNPNGVRAMAMALELNRNVTSFDLTDNFLNDDACFHLGDLLNKNSILEELILDGCRIMPSGTRRLMAGLKNNSTLDSLNLSRNELGDEGGEIIADVLGSSFSLNLKKIYLRYNNLGPTTAGAIADALEFYEKLVVIDLSWNLFSSPMGICNLLNRFEEKTTLNELYLSRCGLTGPRVGASLGKAIKSPNIRILDISYNNIFGESLAPIVSGLPKAKKLNTLNLSYNPMDADDSFSVLSKMRLVAVKTKNVYMENIPVHTRFMELLQKFHAMKSKVDVVITHGPYSFFTAVGKDPREVVLNRANFIAMKPKKNKQDIALIVYQLEKTKEIMDVKDLQNVFKQLGCALDGDLLEEIGNSFPGPKTKKAKFVNIKLLAEYMRRKWPDRKLPPTPPPEPEPVPLPQTKGKDVKGKKK